LLSTVVRVYNIRMEDTPSTEAIFGQAIRDFRQTWGWSQEQLANRMRALGFDWHQTTVSKTETAERPIRLNEAQALAGLFSIPLSGLVSPGVGPQHLRREHARYQTALKEAQLAKIKADAEIEAAQKAIDATIVGLRQAADREQRIREGMDNGEH
jgi:transcriptional regulator with XRE-family HTH domain